MARDAEFRARITADDQASKTLDEVAKTADKLDGSTAEVAVDADDQATDTLDEVQTSAEDLDGTGAEVTADADDNASSTLDDVQSATDDLDGSGATVDVEVDDQASAPLDDVTSKLGDVEGALAALPGPFGELSGLIGGVGPGMSGAALGMVGLVGGVAAAVGDAVGSFQELGIAVGEFVTQTGTSFEDASRLIETADDLGVSVGDMETAIGRMNRIAEDTPAKFDAIGAAVVRNQDGTLNAKDTFLGVVDALGNIQDAGKRADAGFQIFGKGWASIAPLIGAGADDLRARMDSVSESKIFDAGKAQQALALRDAFDNISDATDDLKLKLAQSLAPAIADLAPAIGNAVEALGPLVTGLGDNLTPILEATTTALGALSTAMQGLDGLNLPGWLKDLGNVAMDAINPIANLGSKFDEMKDIFGSTPELSGAVADSFNLTGQSAEDLAAATEVATAASEDQKTQLQGQVDSLQAVIDKQNELAGTYGSFADTQQQVIDKQTDFNDKLAKYNETATDTEAKQKDIDKATRDVTASAIAASDKFSKLDADTRHLAGETASSTSELDAQNASLLNSAASASGPARQGILDYTFALNGIPPEKQTEILTLLDQGKVDQANAVLADASKNRDARLIADADNAALNTANRQLDEASKDRTATIYVRTTPTGVQLGDWTPTKSGKSAPALVGATAAAMPVSVPNASAISRQLDELARTRTVTLNARIVEDNISRWFRLNGR